MRQRKQLIFAITLAGAALLLGFAGGSAPFSSLPAATVQQGPPPPPFGGPGGLDQRLLDQLSLTNDQQTQISALLDGQRTDAQPIRNELMEARDAIRAVVEASTYDDGAVVAQAVIVGQATAELTVLRARTEAAIYQLLTIEQRAMLAALRKQMGPPPRLGD
jgi:Spy/CpxP family protein refolding chaperone